MGLALLPSQNQESLAERPRLRPVEGNQQKPWLQELLQKDFVFFTPASVPISPTEASSFYHEVCGL
jgi:hypothetical protein